MHLPPSEVASFIESWQRCTPNHLPNLFYAFNEANKQTERVVSYRLGEESLKKIVDLKPRHLKILMGCRTGTDSSIINQQPPFVPLLQAYVKKQQPYDHCFFMQWDPTPPFLETDDHSIQSGIDQIPAEGAYLFILGWLEYPYQELGRPFEGIAPHLVKRVRSYTFSENETQKILEVIGEQVEKKTLYIHLGIGISVQKHPFSFRPVLQVLTEKGDAAEEGDDGDFFDFSNPCPPRCGTGND